MPFVGRTAEPPVAGGLGPEMVQYSMHALRSSSGVIVPSWVRSKWAKYSPPKRTHADINFVKHANLALQDDRHRPPAARKFDQYEVFEMLTVEPLPIDHSWMLRASVIKDAVSGFDAYVEKAVNEARRKLDQPQLPDAVAWPRVVEAYDRLAADHTPAGFTAPPVVTGDVHCVLTLRHVLTPPGHVAHRGRPRSAFRHRGSPRRRTGASEQRGGRHRGAQPEGGQERLSRKHPRSPRQVSASACTDPSQRLSLARIIAT